MKVDFVRGKLLRLNILQGEMSPAVKRFLEKLNDATGWDSLAGAASTHVYDHFVQTDQNSSTKRSSPVKELF